MTDTKDDEVKQTAWEAGYEEGYKAAEKLALANKIDYEELYYRNDGIQDTFAPMW